MVGRPRSYWIVGTKLRLPLLFFWIAQTACEIILPNESCVLRCEDRSVSRCQCCSIRTEDGTKKTEGTRRSKSSKDDDSFVKMALSKTSYLQLLLPRTVSYDELLSLLSFLLSCLAQLVSQEVFAKVQGQWWVTIPNKKKKKSTFWMMIPVHEGLKHQVDADSKNLVAVMDSTLTLTKLQYFPLVFRLAHTCASPSSLSRAVFS